jgi:hypothetical protein
MTNQKQALPPPSLQAILGYAGGLLRRQCGHTVVDLVAAARAWFAACVAPWMTWANYNLFIYLGGSESIIQSVYWVEC